jgi:Lon protease-like protein
MDRGDEFPDALSELGALFSAAQATYRTDKALAKLEEELARNSPEENVKLLAAAIAAGPGRRRESLDEAKLKDQLYVLHLREMLEAAEHRIGTNAAVNAMATELAKMEPGELARGLTLAVHLIIHP